MCPCRWTDQPLSTQTHRSFKSCQTSRVPKKYGHKIANIFCWQRVWCLVSKLSLRDLRSARVCPLSKAEMYHPFLIDWIHYVHHALPTWSNFPLIKLSVGARIISFLPRKSFISRIDKPWNTKDRVEQPTSFPGPSDVTSQ